MVGEKNRIPRPVFLFLPVIWVPYMLARLPAVSRWRGLANHPNRSRRCSSKLSLVENSSNGTRVYTVDGDGNLTFEEESVTYEQMLRNVVAAWFLPAGFPESCSPQLGSYMVWRGIQYFFGGALSVLTTRSLLTSLGIANVHASQASAAINWVIKDGAGRMGRFLFARIGGRSLDDKAKQWRLLGDGLMFLGACGELSTSLAPALFLPLACSANLAKNLAAVAASATRAPIYRTFARQNNLADITAKAESVANLSDVVGTAFGILLTKKVSTYPAFMVLSIGYLVASRREVDSVELPYFNKARLALAVNDFLKTGTCPTVKDGNIREPLLPWGLENAQSNRIVLGASLAEACLGNADTLTQAIANTPGSSNYLLTHRRDTRKAYVVLKDGTYGGARNRTLAAYEGCFTALILIHVLGGKDLSAALPRRSRARHAWKRISSNDANPHSESGKKYMNEFERKAVQFVARHGHELFVEFDRKAQLLGWRTRLNTLYTKDARLTQWHVDSI